MYYGANELRAGHTIEVEGQPYLVLEANHHKTVGRGGAIVRTRLRHLETGVIIDRNFDADDKVARALVEDHEVQYLYSDGESYHVMDLETYDQYGLAADLLGDRARFLQENMTLRVSFFRGRPVAVELPVTVEMKVVATDPGVRGDTAAGGSKPATLETGAVVRVPLFINVGDVIRVDTRTGEYAGRA